MTDRFEVVFVKQVKFLDDFFDGVYVSVRTYHLILAVRDQVLLEVLAVCLTVTFKLCTSFIDRSKQLFNLLRLHSHSLVECFQIVITVREI